MIEISLTWPEILLAAQTGVMRYVNAMRLDRHDDSYGKPLWDRHINGAIAEMALAKHLRVFWSGTVGRVDTADVGSLQVRSKTYPHHHLCIRPRDDDRDIFVCVLTEHAKFPACFITGWMRACDIKQPRYAGPHGLYYVPDTDLRPMHELEMAEVA